MRTMLDEARAWFLEELTYAEELFVRVMEGERTPGRVRNADGSFRDVLRVQPRLGGLRLLVRFSRPIAWQVVDEGFTTVHEGEEQDGGDIFRIMTVSRYHNYVKESHGWCANIVGHGVHYRLLLADEVIDVIAHEKPSVEPSGEATRSSL